MRERKGECQRKGQRHRERPIGRVTQKETHVDRRGLSERKGECQRKRQRHRERPIERVTQKETRRQRGSE